MMRDTSTLAEQLEVYGAPRESVLSLEGPPLPDHVPYLDLVRAGAPAETRPDGVVEVQGRPVLFVVRSRGGLQLPRMQRALALRADGSFLGVIEPGRLTIYSTTIAPHGGSTVRDVQVTDSGASDVIPELALAPPAAADADEVHNLLFKLFDHATTTIAKSGLVADDALSLAGRAVFLRFLVDRGVLREDDVSRVCGTAKRFEDCFATPSKVAATSRWLDATFNGDLLPLTADVTRGRAFFGSISTDAAGRICDTLTTIMLRAEPSGQMRLGWSDLDFAHIPVGLLSQVYERHAEMHHAEARTTSVYYTPRAIAEYMVDEAFSALPSPHSARVLDPAAGAGVFLVAAFRKLVEERWRRDGKRPSTATIRKILNQQLAGFEINESALRLSALSLYLTALELDPHPRPVESLRFENLRDTVLFNLSSGETPPYVAGSLGSAVGREHWRRYDVVIGNPPWTSLRRDKRANAYREKVEEGVREAVAERLGGERARDFTLPDDDPDIAFLWRATQWAKESGLIALAMHGRLLFKQSRGGQAARSDIFDGIRITGILNGAAVRQTEVWPRVSAPFCLVFAKNERPLPDSTFYFVSLALEEPLNNRGRIRIDAKAAQTVSNTVAKNEPSLLKTLFRGTSLDVAVLSKLRGGSPTSLGEYWKSQQLEHGDGFQVGGRAGNQQSAKALHGLPSLTNDHLSFGYKIVTDPLPKFDRPTLLRPRRRNLYRSPLVLISQAPDMTRHTPRASLVFEDLVFSRSFIGYSCAGHADAEMLARYVFLLFNSNIPTYAALMTSSQFGVERDVYLADDTKQLPFRPLERLTSQQRADIRRLSESLVAGVRFDWSELDSWVADVYGLNKWDREAVADTLKVSAPSSESRACAQVRPTRATVNSFATRLASELRPFLRKAGISEFSVEPSPMSADEPWAWLILSRAGSDDRVDRRAAGSAADDLGATQIFVCRRGAFDIAILAQNRYWTKTRARLLALDILHRDDLVRALSSGDD